MKEEEDWKERLAYLEEEVKSLTWITALLVGAVVVLLIKTFAA